MALLAEEADILVRLPWSAGKNLLWMRPGLA